MTPGFAIAGSVVVGTVIVLLVLLQALRMLARKKPEEVPQEPNAELTAVSSEPPAYEEVYKTVGSRISVGV